MSGKRCEQCEHNDLCSWFRERPPYRNNLIEAWQGIETVLCSLNGKAPEMPDKVAITVMAQALWIILNWIVRRIDKEKPNGE